MAKNPPPKPDPAPFGPAYGNPPPRYMPPPRELGYVPRVNPTQQQLDAIRRANTHDPLPDVIAALNKLKKLTPHPADTSDDDFNRITKQYVTEQNLRKIAAANLDKPKSGSGGGGGTTKKGGGKSSGGGTSTPAAPAGPSVTDLINNLYAELQKEIDTQTTGTLGDYDTTKQTITDQYKKAQQDLYAKYQATQNPLAAQAANLGVDYGNSSINATQDAALKRLQETGDLSLASDQSYLDKMRLMEQSKFGALKTGATQGQADAQIAYQMYLQQLAAAAKGGSGGGRGGRGGGGGGSGSLKESAKAVSTMTDSGYQGLMNDLYNSGDTEGANYLQQKLDLGGGSESEALKSIAQESQQQLGRVPSKGKGWGGIVQNIKRGAAIQKNTKIQKSVDVARRVQPKLRTIIDAYGNPKIVYTTTATGKP